ncbi:MAG TPA: DUF2341 domain-containing protein [Pyrinomonadaceae bacterium]|nr:DUF2341 domain-containing protein [Pyrinomonadaceae bacterium]
MPLSDSRFRFLYLLFLVLTLSATYVTAQQDQTPKRGFQAGGSYALSDIETINTGNGNLILSIPLASLPAGRGTAPGAGLRLLYNSKMFDSRVERYSQGLPEGGGGCISPSGVPVPCDEVKSNYRNEIESTKVAWRNGASLVNAQGTTYNYTMNLLQGSEEGGWRYGLDYRLQFFTREDEYVGPWTPACPSEHATYKYKLKMAFPDGAVREFHPTGYLQSPTLNDGYYRINYDGWYSNCDTGYYAVTSGMTYYSTDGSHLRLVITHDGDSNPFNNGWTLYMPDGARATGGNAPQRIYDRNNNYIEIQTVTLTNGHTARKVVDQLGRYFLIEYAANNEDHVIMWGVNGEEIRWRVKWKNIWVHKSYVATADHPLPLGETNTREVKTQFAVVDQIILPTQADSLTYTFNYHGSSTEPAWGSYTNGWGEITSVTLPSGAESAYQYTHEQGTPFYADILHNSPTRKELTYQREYDNDTSVATETWLYSISPNSGSTITNPAGGVLLETSNSSGYVYKSVRPDGTKLERIWAVNSPYAGYADNPYVKTEFTSIKNAAGNWDKTAIKDFNYDKNGNVTAVREYDWVSYGSVQRNGNDQPTGVPGVATLKRVTTNAYYNSTPDASDVSTDDPDVYHKATSPPIKNALAFSEVSDGSQVLSRSESFYDDPSTTGNLIQQKSWDASKGGYTNPLGANSISVITQYNQYGGPTLTTNARGHHTQFVYGLVGGFTDLYPTQIKTAYQTTVERTETREYDFNTSLATRITDANNNVSTATTYDAFGRPTLVRTAENKPEETRTATEYSDNNRRVIVRTDLNSAGDGKLVNIQHYDPLGRVRLTRQLEDAASQSATDETIGIKTQTRYMFSGSNSYRLVSNPYRAANVGAAGTEATMGWTRSKSDNGGRIVEVHTFAGNILPAPWGANSTSSGAVSTAYDANFTTVTDQAGKNRRSMLDGLGRLVRVDEPDASNNLGSNGSPIQPTNYTYNALDCLVTVIQGSQTRYFMYDSLKRLIRARNPEQNTDTSLNLSDPLTANSQWSIGYQYDNNGNLTKKTDPRGIAVDFAYDALNRNTSVDYSDTSLNPDITRIYDGATKGAGRLWQTYSGGTETTGATVDHVKIHSYDAQGRPLDQRQRFKTNSVWSAVEYKTERTYDASTITSQKYPSGHIVNFGYDAAGRLTSFTGNLGDGATRTYVTNISYSSSGQWTRERFGTQTPLYNKRHFNARGQLYDMRLSTVNDADNYNRGAIINYYSLINYNTLANYGFGTTGSDTNGNVYVQRHMVPNDDNVSGSSFMQQNYEYDALNRLKSVAEYQNGSTQTGEQVYDYDRWGNRNISSASGLGINSKTFAVNPSTNRLGVPGGQAGTMVYDNAGNLTEDTYSASAVLRTYDAESRLTSEKQAGDITVGQYTYNGDGQRVRRKADGVETWQIYGIDGELLAEYALNGASTSPKKEYGYRNGELLVTLDAPPPAHNGYVYRRTVTIDHNKVPNSDQSNFPMLISGTYSYLATVSNGGNVQNANGYDVIFTSDSGCATKLDHEVETYNATTGAVNYWVEVPTISHNTDTILYMCYGNSSVTTDQSNKSGVWDPSYKGVWHLPNGSNLSAGDSMVNANNGTISGAVAAQAKVGGGGDFNGSSDYIDVKAGKVDTSTTTGTVSAWVRISALDTNGVVLGYGGSGPTAPAMWGVYVRLVSGNRYLAVAGRASEGATYNTVRGSTVLAANTWYYVTYSSNGSAWKIRVNGATAETVTPVLGTNTGQWIGDITPTTPDKSVMGGVYAGGGYSSANFWHGLLDEVRLSNIERSDDWVQTEYNNQNSPSTFYSLSAANGSQTAEARWLVTDHLGTPRIIADETGSLPGIKRHDYLPFGEEMLAYTGGRTPGQGYSGDAVRQKFTSKERDSETGLDYFGSRYYANIQARFTGLDARPVTRESFVNPQRWNQYVYVNNNPLSAVDPDGNDGQGKTADKVISVFLDLLVDEVGERFNTINGKEVPGTRVPNFSDWQGTKAGASNGYKVDLYGPSYATGENGRIGNSDQFEAAHEFSEVVIYVGHGRGGDGRPATDANPFRQTALTPAFRNGGQTHYNSDGKWTAGGPMQPRPDSAAKVFVNFSCDSSTPGGSYFNHTGQGQVIVTIYSGPNGITNADVMEKAASAFVKTYMSSNGNVEKAAHAANKVITATWTTVPSNNTDQVLVNKNK